MAPQRLGDELVPEAHALRGRRHACRRVICCSTKKMSQEGALYTLALIGVINRDKADIRQEQAGLCKSLAAQNQ